LPDAVEYFGMRPRLRRIPHRIEVLSLNRSLLPWLVGVVAVGGVVGWGVYQLVEWTRPRDEIVKFVAPLEKHPEPPQREAMRMFGVLIPVKEAVWTFKVQGKPETMAAFRPKLDKFLETVKFKDGQPTWDAPKEWEELEGKDLRFATLFVPIGPDLLDLSVSKLVGPDARSVLKNVNRWRGQLSLAPMEEADLANVSRKIKVDGNDSDFVDLEGFRPVRKAPPEGKQPPERKQPPKDLPPIVKPKYETPKGWVEKKAAGGFAIAAFGIVDDNDEMAEVTLTPLGGGAGGVGANLERWRDQVGLPPLKEEDFDKEMKLTEFPAGKAVLVDFANPKHRDQKKARIMGAILPRPEAMWFVKMTGPIPLVGAQRAAFEAFLKSLRFGDS